MKSHVMQEGHWGARASGAGTRVMSIFLILSWSAVAGATPSLTSDPVAPFTLPPLASASTLSQPVAAITVLNEPPTRPVPEPAASETPPGNMRITPERKPEDPLFAEAPVAIVPQASAEAQTSVAAPPDPEQSVESQLNELNQRRDALAQKARKCQLQLMDLRRSNDPRREQVSTELRSLYRQMCNVESELLQLNERQQKRVAEQIAPEQEKARKYIEQMENLRGQMDKVQERIQEIDLENRQQTKEIFAAIEQTRRDIHVMEERLNRYGITYEPRTETPLPGPPLPSEPIQPPAVPEMPRLNAEPPEPIILIPPQPGQAEAQEEIENLREQIRRLQAEIDATRAQERAMQEERRPPSRSESSVRSESEQRRARANAPRQREQVFERPAYPPYPDNPYSVGSAGQAWYPNW
jgi:hypothetical protein